MQIKPFTFSNLTYFPPPRYILDGKELDPECISFSAEARDGQWTIYLNGQKYSKMDLYNDLDTVVFFFSSKDILHESS